MKTLLLSFIIALFFSSIAAQTCLPEGITFTTQQQIDDFATDYPGCTEIEGDVNIHESVSGNITNLTGLESVSSIGGDLYIGGNASLSSMMGLDSLSSVGGYLWIYNNNSLTSMTSFGNVSFIGDYLRISSNDSLTSLIGLEGVSSIGGELNILVNNLLSSMVGLDSLNTVGGDLKIDDNDSMKSMTGLESLISIGGDLSIAYNDSLSSLIGLESLNSIEGGLTILGNNSLTNMIGFEGVSTIGKSLRISDNVSLTSMTGLESLSLIGLGLNIVNNASIMSLKGLESLNNIGYGLYISSNDSLTSLIGIQNINPNSIRTGNHNPDLTIINNLLLFECEVRSICDFLVIPGVTTSIYNNAIGCDTQTEIVDACEGSPPFCTFLTTPTNGATNVNVTIDLSWNAAVDATGYRLNVGTMSGGTDIENNTDVGNVTTYDPGNYPCGTNIYVSLAPYNAIGDAIGCIEESFNTPNTNLIPNASATDETSNNGNDGTATSNPVGGTSPYSYVWSNGENTQAISGLASGDYIVTVTDANACTSLDTVTVAAYVCPDLTITSQANNASCDGVCDGSIAILSVNNATAPLTYIWNSGETTASQNNLCTGEYMVTITDAENCTVSDTFMIIEPDEILITVDSIRHIRLDPLGYIFITTNDNGSYIFDWSGPGGFTAATEDIENLSDPGCYTITVTDTLTNCSIDSTICLDDLTTVYDLEMSHINMYPNPTRDNFIIDFRDTKISEANIILYDISGKQQLVLEKQANNQMISVNAGMLNAGLYIISINSAQFGTSFRKVVIGK